MLKELVEKRRRLAEENGDLLAKAKKDGRDVLNADEETEWQQRDAAIEALSKQIDRYVRQEQVEKRLAEVSDPVVQRSQPMETPERQSGMARFNRGQQDIDLALRAWFLTPSEKPVTEEMRAAAERVGLDLHHKMITFNVPSKQARTGAEARSPEYRAQTITTTGGGYAIPDELMREFEAARLFFGGMRQVATVIRTESGADLPIPTANDTGNKGRILNINTQTTKTDVTFGQLVLKAWKYSSDEILVPIELMQDNAINLPARLGEMLGERIGRIQNEHFTTGAGTTLPWGLATRATTGVTGAAGGGITYANLVDLEHSVDIAYRRMGAAWMMNDVKMPVIKKLLDSANRPILIPSTQGISGGFPMELFGYPVVINNDMATAATTGTKGILFGALSKYLVRDVVSVTLLRLDERYADFHQVSFLAFARADGDLLNAGTNPVKAFVHTT